MVKFFRKIRQNLLKTNKIGKYLIYAFGEIILVVIGIIIALQLNNKNQEKANEVKVINILKEIQKDLKTDIEKAIKYHELYVEYDSLQKIIFNNKYTFKDYQNVNTPLIGSYYKEFIPLKNGFNQLSNNINIVPEKYDSIVSKLKTLYEIDYLNITTYNERFKNTVYKNLDFLYSTNWSIDYKRRIRSKELINYFLSDKKYKNYLIKYYNDYENLIIDTQYLRYIGITIFNEIQKITNSTLELPNYMNFNQTNTSKRKAIIGHYKLSSKIGNGWANNLEITQKKESIFWKEENTESLLLYNNKNIYPHIGSSIYFNFKQDTLFIENGISGRGIYIKQLNKKSPTK